MLLLVPVGFAMMLQMASSNTLIQTMVPDQLRGRVMSVYSMMFMGMAPFGALLSGAVAHRIGAPRTVAMGGAIVLAGALLFHSQIPKLRAHARRLMLANDAVGPLAPDAAPSDDAVESSDHAVPPGEHGAAAPR
jgi:MFS family permease